MIEENININIKRIESSIKVRGLGIKEHNAYKYTIIPIYIPNKDNKVTLIRYKIYIIDDLLVKILININIIKLEGIILDTSRDLTIINSYNSLQISISIIIKGLRIDTIILSKARYTVPAYFYITVSIESVQLS